MLLVWRGFETSHHLGEEYHLILIVKTHLLHHFNQQMIVIASAEVLEEAKKHAKIP